MCEMCVIMSSLVIHLLLFFFGVEIFLILESPHGPEIFFVWSRAPRKVVD